MAVYAQSVKRQPMVKAVDLCTTREYISRMRKPVTRLPSDLLRLWTQRQDLVGLLGQSYPTVTSWENRNSIPRQHWPAIVEAAKASSIPQITIEALESAHAAAKALKPPRRNRAVNPRARKLEASSVA